MALGTPVAGTISYSGNQTLNVPYPTGLTATTEILLFTGQKNLRSQPNNGTITTPAGWTLIDQLEDAGGYGTTANSDVGNTSVRVYRKDVVTGTETGNLALTLTNNEVCWGFMVRVSYAAGSTVSFGSADGQNTVAPAVDGIITIPLTNSASPTNFQSGDLAIWAYCIPTDVQTPSAFSARSITATGTTFATAVEFNEPDNSTNDDIGGYSAYAFATAGSSTAAPTVSATVTGTLTNNRGPVVAIRLREVAGGGTPQTITQATRFNEVNDFFAATVTQGGAGQSLTQNARFNETNDFFAATVTTGPVNLTQNTRFSELNDFFAATVTTGPVTLTQTARFSEVNDFFAATLTQTIPSQSLTQTARFDESNDFFSATVTTGPVSLTQNARFSEVNDFFAATVTTGPVSLTQTARFDEVNDFYAATISVGATTLTQNARFSEVNDFFAATVTTGPFGLVQNARFNEVNDFYAATVTTGPVALTQTVRYDNATTFYTATITSGATSLTQTSRFNATTTFYPATLSVGAFTLVQNLRFDNVSSFYTATVTTGPVTLTQNARFNNTNTLFPASIGDGSEQPILSGGTVTRPRRFRPAILFDFPEKEVVLPDLNAKARLAGLSATLSLGSVVATSPDPINSRTSLAFTQIETYMRSVNAQSSWNDPSDEELLFILDFALD
jgi:hypothetical protein